MKILGRFRCRSNDGRVVGGQRDNPDAVAVFPAGHLPRRTSDELRVYGPGGNRVGTFDGSTHDVEIATDGELRVVKRKPTTGPPTHQELLKRLNAQNAELWRRS